MILEDQRLIHEDLERLEDAIADRLQEDPKHIRERLARDHDIRSFLESVKAQSERLMAIYKDVDRERERELQALGTGDSFEMFKNAVKEVRDFHARYPNEPVENLEKAYKQRTPEDHAAAIMRIENMFRGEEGFGRFFDLTMLHEQYLNLPVHQHARRLTYLQYLDVFDAFAPPQSILRREQKLSDPYFQYLKALADYLESFMRKTKPLENLDKLFANFDSEFDEKWANGEIPGWEKESNQLAPEAAESQNALWCSACQKSFANEAVYENHLKGKKHKKNEAQMAADNTNGVVSKNAPVESLKERAVAEKEFRIARLAASMQTERSDTKVNVERRQGMTERERQQELEAMYSETIDVNGGNDENGNDSDDEDKIYNPLKLPLAWDGKPIPVWLYRLHGLGVEFPCEICGNYVYMGRRAFDKHFNEPRHVFGLKCLGITNTSLYRDITSIEQAKILWNKIQTSKKKEKASVDNIVQMEDSEGNVMPEKIYNDLLAQGIL